MTYNEIATKLVTDELAHIKSNPKQACIDYQWDKFDSHAHKHIKRLVVNEYAVDRLATRIEFDYAIRGLWQQNENSECEYDDLMMAEYLEDILKDFIFQMKSFTVGIPLDFTKK